MIALTSEWIGMGIFSVLLIGAGLALLWCAARMKREEQQRR